MSGDSTREIDMMPRPLATAGRSIVLVGLMGAGKTSVGKRLAKALDENFRDADEEIVSAAGMSIPEIFQSYGETGFRDLERRVISRLLDEPPMVLALGGGAFIDPMTRLLCRERGLCVWLKADLDTLVARTARKRGTRPLLEGGDPREILERLMHERYPIYAEADHTIETGDQPPDMIVARILELLAERPDG